MSNYKVGNVVETGNGKARVITKVMPQPNGECHYETQDINYDWRQRQQSANTVISSKSIRYKSHDKHWPDEIR